MSMMPSHEILPTYFGTAEKPLFGFFNEPRSGRARSCAVVICQPIGHEYVNSHRALRQLAVRLAERGFPVIRFDYFGSGDSSGDSADGRISQWLDDLSQAILEIKHRTNLPSVCLIGLRLGASLSLMASTQRSDIQNMILWDPVVKGRPYLEGWLSLKKEMLRFRPKSKKNELPGWPKDIFGFPLTSHLSKEIDVIDLLEIPLKPAGNILIVETEKPAFQNNLKDVLEATGASVSLQHVDAPPIWLPTVNGSLLVPGAVLQSVTSWMDRMCP
jgi:uncharacterized protein